MTISHTRKHLSRPLSLTAAATLFALACGTAAYYGAQPANAWLLTPALFHHTPHAVHNHNTNWFDATMRLHNDLQRKLFKAVKQTADADAANTKANAKAKPSAAVKKPAATAATTSGSDSEGDAGTPFRRANTDWDDVVSAQLLQLQCAKHCADRQRNTLPYVATFAEKVVKAKPVSGAYFEAMGGTEITLRLPNVNPQDVAVNVDVDTLTIRAARAPQWRPHSSLDDLCECSCGGGRVKVQAEEDGAIAEGEQNSDGRTGTTDGAAAASEEEEEQEVVTRVYQLGPFVKTEFIDAKVESVPSAATVADVAACAGTKCIRREPPTWTTILTVRVPNGFRPPVRHITLQQIDTASAALAAVGVKQTATKALEPAATPALLAAPASAAPTTSAAAATSTAAATPAPAAATAAAEATPASQQTTPSATPITTDAHGDEVITL